VNESRQEPGQHLAGQQPAGQQSAGQQSAEEKTTAEGGSAPLERRYRRLLAWYPAEHRRIYGEEMLGVLMAAAPTGRTRVSFADALDLARSGARARLGAVGSGTDPPWRDALAVYSLLAPVLASVAIYRDPVFLGALLWGHPLGLGPFAAIRYAGLHLSFPAVGIISFVLLMATPLMPVILGLLGLRRTALSLCAFLLIWTTVQASLGWQIQAPNTAAFLVLLAVEIAALAVSAGPRRGLRLLTWKGVLLASPWLAAGAVVGMDQGVPSLANDGKYLALLAVVTAAATLVSARTRRLLLLFAIPGSPLVDVTSYPDSTLGMYLTPAFVALIAFVISRRSWHNARDRGSPAMPAR
jgi:hypothetical protein